MQNAKIATFSYTASVFCTASKWRIRWSVLVRLADVLILRSGVCTWVFSSGSWLLQFQLYFSERRHWCVNFGLWNDKMCLWTLCSLKRIFLRICVISGWNVGFQEYRSSEDWWLEWFHKMVKWTLTSRDAKATIVNSVMTTHCVFCENSNNY